MKKCIAGLLLLAFAVPSWAEDEVWYCVEEHEVRVEAQIDGDLASLNQVSRSKLTMLFSPTNRFTLMWDKTKGEIRFDGSNWGEYTMQYESSFAPPEGVDIPFDLEARDRIGRFQLTGKKYFYTSVISQMATLSAGTCTKF